MPYHNLNLTSILTSKLKRSPENLIIKSLKTQLNSKMHFSDFSLLLIVKVNFIHNLWDQFLSWNADAPGVNWG